MATIRITNKDIKASLDRLNRALGRATEPYTKLEDGTYQTNIGNFHDYCAYGMVGLHEMFNEGGGVKSHGQLGTKRELYERIHAMLDGIGLVNDEV